MSTYWYLECSSHTPPLRSLEEVEQHTSGLPAVRELVARRGNTNLMTYMYSEGAYFQKNAVGFLLQHSECPLRLVNEYDTYDEGDLE